MRWFSHAWCIYMFLFSFLSLFVALMLFVRSFVCSLSKWNWTYITVRTGMTLIKMHNIYCTFILWHCCFPYHSYYKHLIWWTQIDQHTFCSHAMRLLVAYVFLSILLLLFLLFVFFFAGFITVHIKITNPTARFMVVTAMLSIS